MSLSGFMNSIPYNPALAGKVSNFSPPSNPRRVRFAHDFNEQTPLPENLHVFSPAAADPFAAVAVTVISLAKR
jgi:hypothetical protein